MTTATGMGPLPELLKERGGRKAVDKVFAAEGVPLAVIKDRQHKIPMVSFGRLFQSAAQRAGDNRFGLAVGFQMSPGEYGLWVRYAMQATTLGEAISRIVQTLHVHQTGTTMRIARRCDGQVAWEYWHPGARTELFRQHTDHVVPVMIRIVQGYLGPKWRPSLVEVGYSAPHDAADMEADTGTHWVFDRSCQAILMPSSALRAKRPHSYGPVVSYADVVAETKLEATYGPIHDIAAVVSLRLLDGISDIDGAAQALGTGRRTLQRRLEHQGLTYRSLLNRIRMERAKDLIEGSDVSLKRICSELGYSDPAHFARAFGSYFGYPPSLLREKGIVTGSRSR